MLPLCGSGSNNSSSGSVSRSRGSYCFWRALRLHYTLLQLLRSNFMSFLGTKSYKTARNCQPFEERLLCSGLLNVAVLRGDNCVLRLLLCLLIRGLIFAFRRWVWVDWHATRERCARAPRVTGWAVSRPAQRLKLNCFQAFSFVLSF